MTKLASLMPVPMQMSVPVQTAACTSVYVISVHVSMPVPV